MYSSSKKAKVKTKVPKAKGYPKGRSQSVSYRQVNTSCCKKTSAYTKPADLQVEKDISKNKEVKESDVFDLPKKKK